MDEHSQEIEQILNEIRSKTRFLLTSHINPDGDGLGSELALYELLELLQKEVRIINASPLPMLYRFMDPADRIFKQYTPECDAFIELAEVIIVLDISEIHRLGAVGKRIEKTKAVRICIDHHSSNHFPADILLIDEKAVSTGELIEEIIRKGGYEITPRIAEALYIAVMTDTGCFRFSNTNAKAHYLGAEFLEKGADHFKVYNQLYENNSWEKTYLFASVLSTLRPAAERKIAVMHITLDMLEKSGALYEDIEGFVEFARNVRGVKMSLLFVEQPNNRVKVSFRSSGTIAVNELASEFGGGGHRNASAAVVQNSSLENAITTVITSAKKYLR